MGRGTFLWILIFYFRYSLPPLHFNSKAGTQMQIDIKLNLFIYIYTHTIQNSCAHLVQYRSSTSLANHQVIVQYRSSTSLANHQVVVQYDQQVLDNIPDKSSPLPFHDMFSLMYSDLAPVLKYSEHLSTNPQRAFTLLENDLTQIIYQDFFTRNCLSTR